MVLLLSRMRAAVGMWDGQPACRVQPGTVPKTHQVPAVLRHRARLMACHFQQAIRCGQKRCGQKRT